MKTRRCVLRVSFVCQERISTWQDQKARMRFRIGLPRELPGRGSRHPRQDARQDTFPLRTRDEECRRVGISTLARSRTEFPPPAGAVLLCSHTGVQFFQNSSGIPSPGVVSALLFGFYTTHPRLVCANNASTKASAFFFLLRPPPPRRLP